MKEDWYSHILEDCYGRDDIKALYKDGKYYDEHGEEIDMIISSKRIHRVIDEKPEYEYADDNKIKLGKIGAILALIVIVAFAFMLGQK